MSNDLLPCEVNANVSWTECELLNNGCPIEAFCGAKGAYEIVKAFNPVKTTVKEGVNLKELVKAKFPDYYDYFNKYLNWNDVDGILDFLYFHAKTLHVVEAQQLIDLIENNCEVRRG